MVNVKVKLLTQNAKLPSKATSGAAGFDLYAAEAVTIPSQGRRLIKTNVAMEIPAGFYGRIAPRSGLAFKHGLDVMAGVIDSDYRGDVGVILYNTDTAPFEVKAGDRIAQIIFEFAPEAAITDSDLSDTSRGGQGYGHTGK